MALKQLKHMVSKKKRRFKEDGFDLDLSYINDNIIAMGFPAENLEGVYRNHIDDVVRFMESRHKDHYRIYNLCRDRAYNTTKFRDRVMYFPLDDHHPPGLHMMRPFCEDVHRWLSTNSENVAAVHCKAGKGRTGVMICAYLLFAGAFTSPDEALAYYGARRTTDMNGVTIPSQRRYVYYFGRLLNENLEYRSVPMLLKAIHFEMIPTFEKNGTCCPYFVVSSHDKKIHRSPAYETVRGARCLSMDIPLDQNVSVVDDVRVDFFHRPGRLQKREKMFHFWFNTFFVCPGAGSPAIVVCSSNHNRIQPKQSDPEFGARSVVFKHRHYNYHHRHQNHNQSHSPAAFAPPNGTLSRGDECGESAGSSSAGSNGSRKDSSLTATECTSSLSVRPNRCHSSPQPADLVYACHHVLTLGKNELDVAFKDKACKRFPANFKVHVVLQCADLSHCPLATKYGDAHQHQHYDHQHHQHPHHLHHPHHHHQTVIGGVKHEKVLPEEATDEEDVSSTTDTDEDEELDLDLVDLASGGENGGGGGEGTTTREEEQEDPPPAPPSSVDEDGRLMTTAFCHLCRRSREALEQEAADCSPREPLAAATSPQQEEREDEESSSSEVNGGGSGGLGCLLMAPSQKWSNRRSSSPR